MKITSKEHDNSEDEKEINESILMLGDRLADNNYSLIPESCNLFTNSDQESTSGEEDVLGMHDLNIISFLMLTLNLLFFLDEEEIDKLNPNYALYKATSAHNLPVMCQAISLGADKNWENVENLNRTPLHQAIIAVSSFLFDRNLSIDQRYYCF
jgi:Arf-GAP with coiled-coil, ANK repeat and PH domain-containing protein